MVGCFLLVQNNFLQPTGMEGTRRWVSWELQSLGWEGPHGVDCFVPLIIQTLPLNLSFSNNVGKGDMEGLIYLDLGGISGVFSRREAVNLETEGVDGRVTRSVRNWLKV